MIRYDCQSSDNLGEILLIYVQRPIVVNHNNVGTEISDLFEQNIIEQEHYIFRTTYHCTVDICI